MSFLSKMEGKLLNKRRWKLSQMMILLSFLLVTLVFLGSVFLLIKGVISLRENFAIVISSFLLFLLLLRLVFTLFLRKQIDDKQEHL